MGPTNLTGILQPYSLQEFLESTWGKRFRHVPGQPGKFASLLPWSRLNSLLREHHFEDQRLRLVMNRNVVPPETYRYRGSFGPDPRLDPVQVNQLVREGATLIVNAIDRMVEPIAELTENLQKSLHQFVEAAAFASWGAAPGFGLEPHTDAFDALIVQVAGRKRWVLYGDAPAIPGVSTGEADAAAVEPVWDQALEEGDLLYVPRGWRHAAVPLAEPTLHLTLICRNVTGIDFLRWLQEELQASPLFQQNLPRFGTAAQQSEHMARLRAELLEAVDEKGLERFFFMNDAAAVPHPRFNLPWSAMPAALPPTDAALVRITSPREITVRVGADPQIIELWANGERWQFSSQAHDLLHALVDGKPHSIAELCAGVRETLTRERVRALLSDLLLQGLIAIVEPPCLPLELDEAAD